MKYAAKHSAKHMESSKPVCRHLPSFVFILFIFGFAIWFLINPKADYSSSEKRYLQKFPTVSVNSVLDGKFGTDFEKYFADHFPLRTQWVGANAYFNLSVGNNGADGVYNCKNGYLINKPILDTDTLESNVQTIADFAKSVDVPVTVTLVPSTGYIANDVLPAVHDTYTDDEKSRTHRKCLPKAVRILWICVPHSKMPMQTARSFTTKPTIIGQRQVHIRVIRKYASRSE